MFVRLFITPGRELSTGLVWGAPGWLLEDDTLATQATRPTRLQATPHIPAARWFGRVSEALATAATLSKERYSRVDLFLCDDLTQVWLPVWFQGGTQRS